MSKKPLFQSAKLIPLSALAFAVAYVALFYAHKSGTAEMFQAANQAVPSIRMYGMDSAERIREGMEKYAALGSVAFGLLNLLFMLIAWALLGLLRVTRLRFGMPLVVLLGLTPLGLLGLDMVFFTKGYMPLVNGIDAYIGFPLFYASVATMALGLASLILSLSKTTGKMAGLLLAFISPLFLSGCVWDAFLLGAPCGLVDQASGHCYQQDAVQNNDPAGCEKVTAPPEFAKAGSNPPRDKCLDMVAQNSADPKICDGIKGGIGSYTKEECVKNVATSNNKPSVCTGLSAGAAECANQATGAALEDMDKRLKTGKPLSKTEQKEFQKTLEDIQKMSTMLSDINKSTYDMQKALISNLR